MILTKYKKRFNSENWSRYYRLFENKPSENFKKIMAFFKKNKVNTLLDLGCGAGRHAIPLSKLGFQVYGFDNSRMAVKITRSRLEKSFRHRIIVWDMLKAFPYESGFFDAVFASRVMYHAKVYNIHKIIGEATRVLKKGGWFYFEGPTFKQHKVMLLKGYKLKEVEPGTYFFLNGKFKGGFYHCFDSKKEVAGFFDYYKIKSLVFEGDTFTLLAQKK